jgi:hypothetical protein
LQLRSFLGHIEQGPVTAIVANRSVPRGQQVREILRTPGENFHGLPACWRSIDSMVILAQCYQETLAKPMSYGLFGSPKYISRLIASHLPLRSGHHKLDSGQSSVWALLVLRINHNSLVRSEDARQSPIRESSGQVTLNLTNTMMPFLECKRFNMEIKSTWVRRSICSIPRLIAILKSAHMEVTSREGCEVDNWLPPSSTSSIES